MTSAKTTFVNDTNPKKWILHIQLTFRFRYYYQKALSGQRGQLSIQSKNLSVGSSLAAGG